MSEKRILVVDDEPEIIELLDQLLADNGYQVDSAPDATAALDLVREHNYDAAILDFSLPDMDGVMLHRRIRTLNEDLAERTLFVSGIAQSKNNLGYYATYGQGFLSKPFDVREVLESLANLWDGDEDLG